MLGAFRCWKPCRSGRPRKASGPGLWSRWIGCVEILEIAWTNGQMTCFCWVRLTHQVILMHCVMLGSVYIALLMWGAIPNWFRRISLLPSLSHPCTVFWVRHVREMYVKSFKDPDLPMESSWWLLPAAHTWDSFGMISSYLDIIWSSQLQPMGGLPRRWMGSIGSSPVN